MQPNTAICPQDLFDLPLGKQHVVLVSCGIDPSCEVRTTLRVVSLLKKVKNACADSSKVLVVLGNGHGTREARTLLQDAASEGDIATDIHLVTEAGASVWSVSEGASKEFVNEAPAAIAAVSIGRR